MRVTPVTPTTELRRSKRIPKPRKIFEIVHETKPRRRSENGKKTGRKPKAKDIIDERTVNVTPLKTVPRCKPFTQKRQGLVAELKKTVASARNGAYGIETFSDPNFVMIITQHMKKKRQEVSGGDVRNWIRLHSWIVDDKLFNYRMPTKDNGPAPPPPESPPKTRRQVQMALARQREAELKKETAAAPRGNGAVVDVEDSTDEDEPNGHGADSDMEQDTAAEPNGNGAESDLDETNFEPKGNGAGSEMEDTVHEPLGNGAVALDTVGTAAPPKGNGPESDMDETNDDTHGNGFLENENTVEMDDAEDPERLDWSATIMITNVVSLAAGPSDLNGGLGAVAPCDNHDYSGEQIEAIFADADIAATLQRISSGLNLPNLSLEARDDSSDMSRGALDLSTGGHVTDDTETPPPVLIAEGDAQYDDTVPMPNFLLDMPELEPSPDRRRATEQWIRTNISDFQGQRSRIPDETPLETAERHRQASASQGHSRDIINMAQGQGPFKNPFSVDPQGSLTPLRAPVKVVYSQNISPSAQPLVKGPHVTVGISGGLSFPSQVNGQGPSAFEVLAFQNDVNEPCQGPSTSASLRYYNQVIMQGQGPSTLEWPPCQGASTFGSLPQDHVNAPCQGRPTSGNINHVNAPCQGPPTSGNLYHVNAPCQGPPTSGNLNYVNGPCQGRPTSGNLNYVNAPCQGPPTSGSLLFQNQVNGACQGASIPGSLLYQNHVNAPCQGPTIFAGLSFDNHVNIQGQGPPTSGSLLLQNHVNAPCQGPTTFGGLSFDNNVNIQRQGPSTPGKLQDQNHVNAPCQGPSTSGGLSMTMKGHQGQSSNRNHPYQNQSWRPKMADFIDSEDSDAPRSCGSSVTAGAAPSRNASWSLGASLRQINDSSAQPELLRRSQRRSSEINRFSNRLILSSDRALNRLLNTPSPISMEA